MDNHVSDKPLKRALGTWGVQEFAVAGAPCTFMEQWVKQRFFLDLPVKTKVYVDEDHHPAATTCEGDGVRVSGERFEWNTSVAQNPLNHALAVLNGHHFNARHYLLFTDVGKVASLQKRDAHIQHILAVVLGEHEVEVPAHIRALSAWNDAVQVIKHDEVGRLQTFICNHFLKAAGVKALVLTGGRSTRMGEDKALIHYHSNTPHYAFLLDQCAQAGLQPHLSVGVDCSKHYPTTFPILEDAFIGCGPLSGILTAFRYDPESAWCVVACDLPQVEVRAIKRLLEERDPWSDATAFFNDEKQWYEPLCAVWEPSMYAKALQQLAMGKTCPRKLLQTGSLVKGLYEYDKRWVVNANTPAERDRWMNVKGA